MGDCDNKLVSERLFTAIVTRLIVALKQVGAEHENRSLLLAAEGFIIHEMLFTLQKAWGESPNVFHAWVAFYMWTKVRSATFDDEYAYVAHMAMYGLFQSVEHVGSAC